MNILAKFHIKSGKIQNPSSGCCCCLMSRKFAYQGVSWSELGKCFANGVDLAGFSHFGMLLGALHSSCIHFQTLICTHRPPNANTNPALAPKPTERPSHHHSMDFKSLTSSMLYRPTPYYHLPTTLINQRPSHWMSRGPEYIFEEANSQTPSPPTTTPMRRSLDGIG